GKALLLFNTLEVRNGTRTRSLNEFTHQLVSSLDRDTIERLANRHGIAPKGEAPWRKAVTGGSDDHSGINPGETWTEFPLPKGRAPQPNDLVDAIRARRTSPAGAHGGPVTLAHAMVKLIYDGHRLSGAAGGTGGAQKNVTVGGPIQSLLRFVFDSGSLRLREKLAFQSRLWLQKAFGRLPQRRAAADRPFERILAGEASALLGDKRFQQQLAAAERTDERIFTVVSTLVNRIFQRYVARIRQGRSLDFVRVIKEVVALVSSNLFVSLPYLLSYLHQSSDRMIVRDVRKRFGIDEQPKLVLVTDTFFEINGVARTIRRMIDEAERRGVDFTVATCLGEHEREQALRDEAVRGWVERGRLKILPAIVNLDFPEYKGLQLRVPPFLELLKWLQESGFTKMQISTPGTVGVAGLLAAKILQIETASTYHTCFPEYVESYTKDISLEALAWRYMILFYHSVDEVVVPSKFIARLLHQRGLRKRKLLVLDRWVDLQRFHPEKRDAGFWMRRGIERAPELVKFVYVGRVSAEKNLGLLADAYRKVHAANPRTHLIVIGDGPFRRELEQRLAGVPATFTGFLEGEELSAALASADAKLFPSTTDTWGNAPLEAQASGLPVVVSDMGGPQELMVHGVTGFRVDGQNVDRLAEAMSNLLDHATRLRMGRNAREFVEMHRVDEPFTAIFDSESYRQKVRGGKRAAEAERREEAEAPEPEVIGVDYAADRARLMGA
ncbi:MAG: glycosyltransferase, partial [Planctomycetes bacterium]|nr:glycosyltransferase [Planctomycetota bacterium]